MGFLGVIRIILAIFNILANLVGFLFTVVIIVIGIVGLVAINFYFSGMGQDLLFYNVGFSLFIAVGVIASLFTVAAIVGSYMACCPASKVVKIIAVFLLTVHLVAFVVVFIMALAGVIVAFVYRDLVATNFVAGLNNVINESYSLDFNTTQAVVTVLQSTVGCCGVNGPSDFLTYPGYTAVTTFLPSECCNGTLLCSIGDATEAVGCGPLLQDMLVNYYNVIGGIGIFELVVILLLIVVELLLIILIVTASSEDGGMKIV